MQFCISTRSVNEPVLIQVYGSGTVTSADRWGLCWACHAEDKCLGSDLRQKILAGCHCQVRQSRTQMLCVPAGRPRP